MSDENKPMLDMSGDDYDDAQGSVEPQPEEEVNSEPAGAYVPDHSTVPIDEDSGYDDPLVKPPAAAEGSEPLMSPGMAAAWFGGCFVLFLIGWFCHSFSAIPNLILALLFTTASLTVFRSLKVKRWVLHTCLLVGISVVYLFGLFLFHKVWLDSFSNFGEHVVGLTRKAGDAVSSGSAEDVKAVKVPVKIAGDSIIAAKGFLAISAKNKFKMWAQLVFFSASIFLFSLTVIHATPGLGRPVTGSEKGFMTWFGPTAHRCTSAIGAFALARIIKAIVICMICGIGLRMASVPLGPFIAGTVFCFALVSYLSPAVALVLGSIAIWAVGWSWSALGGLLVV